MPKKLASTKSQPKKTKSSSKSKDSNFIPIDPDVRNKENTRCSAWHGDEDSCKTNKCWYYRNSKKCKAHLGILSGKLPKNSSKRSSLKKMRSIKSRKGSKRSRRRSKRRSSSRKYRF
jgi:hypothetical protein